MASAEAGQKGVLISPVPLPKPNEYQDVKAKELKKIDVKAHTRKLGINTEYR